MTPSIKNNKTIIIISATVLVAITAWFMVPLKLFNKPLSTVVQDRNGLLLGAVTASDDQWRFPPLDTIPYKFATSIITFEDKRFYSHFGIDPISLVRAIIQDVTAKKIVSGASTISMQVIRMARNHNSRSLLNKLCEAIETIKLEFQYSKNEILALYSNNAPFGGNVVGLSAASWRYYGRSPEHLSWAESATLAVLPNAPSIIHPGKNRDRLVTKRNILLYKLYKNGIIDSTTYSLAILEDVPQKPHPLPMIAPHLVQKFSALPSGKIINSTIDYYIQKRANTIVLDHYNNLKQNLINNIALLVIDIKKNEVLAYVGNIPPTIKGEDNFVNIIDAPRSSGSILKPFLYAHLIQEGKLLPTQLVPDIPSSFGGFIPQNYSLTYSGAVPANVALAKSLNIPAVFELQTEGVANFYKLLQELGISTLYRKPHDYGLSLILGGAEITLWDIASLYSGLSRTAQLDSTTIPFQFYTPKLLMSQEIEKEEKENPINSGAAFITLKYLQDVKRPNEESNWREFSSTQKIAWKTGTSMGFRDAWAVGVTPQYCVAVWVGNANGVGRPDLVGSKAAAPILFDVFNTLPTTEWFTPPYSTVDTITVCKKSGYLKGGNCKDGKNVIIPRSAIDNGELCPFCKSITLDSSARLRVNSNCYPVSHMVKQKWFSLPPAEEYYYKKSNSQYESLPHYKDGCIDTEERNISIIYPKNKSEVYIPTELDGTVGKVVFRASSKVMQDKLYWYLDNTYIGETERNHQMAVSSKSGLHRITVVNRDGESVSHTFTVLNE